MGCLYVIIKTGRTAVLLSAATLENVYFSIDVDFWSVNTKIIKEVFPFQSKNATVGDLSVVMLFYVEHDFLQKGK